MSEKLTKAIGIVSWFPSSEPMRGQRMSRLKRLIAQIDEMLPGLPLIIIAQNWNGFKYKRKNGSDHIYEYPQLGILGARRVLRQKFLQLGYDYLIMFDDDAILDEDNSHVFTNYLNLMDVNPQGFAFAKKPEFINKDSGSHNPYIDSQLNFCAISRYIYEKEDIPMVDPQHNICYEDRIFSMLLHIKYKNYEFDIPQGVHSIHFKNPKYPLPSTWAKAKNVDLGLLNNNTIKVEEYIYKNGDLPKDIIAFLKESQNG